MCKARRLLFLFIFPLISIYADDAASLTAFSAPERIYGSGIEATIEAAYRECFKTFIIDGHIMNLRLPFAENHERTELAGVIWEVEGKGKYNPLTLWPRIDAALASADFKNYAATINDGREKVVVFDLPSQTWRVTTDVFDLARIKAGSYHGLPHKPYIFVSQYGLTERDVYNWLYCVARLGFDCSGFVWHVESRVAERAGVNLGAYLGRVLGAADAKDASYYAGTAFYDAKSKEILAVPNHLAALRPADIILFRARDNTMSHSAVIQSIDFEKGVIRYLQNTDEAPAMERGPHESFIYFDPATPQLSLNDPKIRWTQRRADPFEGEAVSSFSDDGERFRAYGGGRVVRLKVLAAP